MDSKIDAFNWDLKFFLGNLTTFRNNVNKANSVTLKLLNDALLSIEKLVIDADVLHTSEKDDLVLLSFDQTKFEVNRSLSCRLCCVQIPLERLDYQNHILSEKHNAAVVKHKNHQDRLCAIPAQNLNSPTNETNLPEAIAPYPANRKNITNPQQRSSDNSKNNRINGQNNAARNAQNMPALDGIVAINKRLNKQDAVTDTNNNGMTKKDPSNSKGLFPKSYEVAETELINFRELEKKNLLPPNVFDENIFEFIDSQSSRDAESHLKEVTTSINPENLACTPFLKSANQAPMVDDTVMWRERSVAERKVSATHPVNAQAQEPWRQRSALAPAPQSANTEAGQWRKVGPSSTVSANLARYQVDSRSVTHNGNIVTGAIMKPVQAYDLNNMYEKFPHLNPEKQLPLSGIGATNPMSSATSINLSSLTSATALTSQSQPTHAIASKCNRNDKLKQMFEEINKQKSAKELTQQHQRVAASHTNLNKNPNLVTSLPALFSEENRLTTPNTASHRRDQVPQTSASRSHRSLSNTPRVNQRQSHNQPQNFKNGAAGTPKQPMPNKSRYGENQAPSSTMTKTDVPKSIVINTKMNEFLKEFYARDLIPIISYKMERSVRLKELPIHKTITDCLEKSLKNSYQSVQCYVFGSRTMGTTVDEQAPVDVFLDLHKSFNKDKNGTVLVQGINDTCKIMRGSTEWSDIRCSDQTRYAVVSAEHNATQLKCHLTFGTGVSVRNSQVINCLFDVQPVCRQVVICIRLSLQEMPHQQLNKFTGYVVSLFVVFYFQVQKKLPSVKELQQNCPRIQCGENSVEFKKPINVIICKDRVRDILIGFFEYYASFDFKDCIISVFEGQEIKWNFLERDEKCLSSSMLRFKRFIDLEQNKWLSSMMCVQDVFMHKRNATQSIRTSDIELFQNYCKQSLEALRSIGDSIRY